jgi:hypothetical protein
LFLKSIITFFVPDFHFNSFKAALNSSATHTQKIFIFIKNVEESITFVSIFFTTIFALIILKFNSVPSLKIVKFTEVQADPFIQEVTSVRELFFVTSLFHTFKIMSPHFIPIFSAGLPGIGFTILGTHGLAIST